MANIVCPIRINRGPELEQLTNAIMQELGANASAPLPGALSNNNVINDLLLWFHHMAENSSEMDQAIKDERKSYYRAFFNLSIDKRSRSKLAEVPDVFRTLVRFMEATGTDEYIGTFVAGLANMVFEDTSKRALMSAGDIPRIFLGYLRNTNVAVASHTARGIFSLTTIVDFKKRFADQEGVLSTLIENLTRENSASLVMNSAGAIANIAIHPECKTFIVRLGALDPLMDVARSDDDEAVLHQVSRCLFSLAAEKTNRSYMCDKGIMPILSRLLNFSNNVEILINAVGCFGNLVVSEKAIIDQGVALALRIVPIMQRLTNNSLLDRQLMRVLLALSQQPPVKAALTEDRSLEALIYKLGLPDAHVVRDVFATLSALVCGSDKVRERLCELGAVQQAVDLFLTHSDKPASFGEVVAPLMRFLFAVVGCAEAKNIVCLQQEGKAIKALCDYIQRILVAVKGNTACKHALGALATIACEEKHAPMLMRHGVLACGLMTMFTSSRPDCRRQAGRLLYNLVRRHGVALSYMCRFGGPDGERIKLESDLKNVLRSTFSFFPSNVAGPTLLSKGSSKGEKVKEGTMQVEVLCVVNDHPTHVETFVATVPEAIVNARCPDLKGQLKGIATYERIWKAFFEFICTNSIASFGLEGTRTSEDLVSLDQLVGLVGLRQGLVRDAIWDNPRVLPMLEDDQPLFALMTSSSASNSLSQPNESSSLDVSNTTPQRFAMSSSSPSIPSSSMDNPSNATTPITTTATPGGIDFTGDVSDEDGFSNSGSSSEVDPGIATLSNDWTKCMTTRMLSNRQAQNKQLLLASDEILLRPEPWTEDEPASSAAEMGCNSPIRTRAKRRIRGEGIEQSSARNASSSPLGQAKTKSSPFIRSLLEEWKVNRSIGVTMMDVSATTGSKRKRKHAQMAASSEGEVLFRAHKTVLSARSRYFRSMFRGPFSESAFASRAKGQEEEVNRVVDFRGPADVLVVVLRYFYCGLDNELMDALSTDIDLCWRTFLVAHEYLLEGLQFYCERAIMATLTNMEDAVHASDALDLVNAPFIKTCCAHIAHLDSQKHSKTKRNLAIQVLENVGLPTTLCPIQLGYQRIDNGGVECNDELGEEEAGGRSSNGNGRRKRTQPSATQMVSSSSA